MEIYTIQFNNNIIDIIENLRNNTNKDIKKTLKTYYLNNCENFTKIDFIATLSKRLSKYDEDLKKRDESLFSEDYYKGPLYLFNDNTIDFKVIWKNYSGEKEYLWTKLHILYTLSLYITIMSEKYENAKEKYNELYKQMKDNLSTKQKIEYELKKQAIEDKESSSIDYDKLKSMFGEGIITDILIDIIKEILGNEINIETVTGLLDLQSDNSIRNELIEKMQIKINENLLKHNMTYDQLLSESENMKDKFMSIAKSSGNPLFVSLAEKINDLINSKFNSPQGPQSNDPNAPESNAPESNIGGPPEFDMNDTLDSIKQLLNDLPGLLF